MNTYAQSKLDAYKNALAELAPAADAALKMYEEWAANPRPNVAALKKNSNEINALLGVGLSSMMLEGAVMKLRNATTDALSYAKALAEECEADAAGGATP